MHGVNAAEKSRFETLPPFFHSHLNFFGFRDNNRRHPVQPPIGHSEIFHQNEKRCPPLLAISIGAFLVLISGYFAGKLVERVRLPALLGMFIFGILMGRFGLGLLNDDFIELTPLVSALALVVVIISSFFAMDVEVLRRSKTTIGLVGTIPGLFEGFAVLVAAVLLLGFTGAQGGILGFTIAIVSPAVVVPTMILLKEQGWGWTRVSR